MREIAQRDVARIPPSASDERRCPVELLTTLGEAGAMGLLVSSNHGGIGMTTVGFGAAMEELGRIDQSVAAAWQAHLTIGSLPLLHFGSVEHSESGGGLDTRELIFDDVWVPADHLIGEPIKDCDSSSGLCWTWPSLMQMSASSSANHLAV